MTKEVEIPKYEKQTVAELKQELSARGLPVSGNKKDLIERLVEEDKMNNDNHIADEIIEANSLEVEKENHEEEEAHEDEHLEERDLEHPVDEEGDEFHGVQSDDELDEVLGDGAREAFEEMKEEEYDEEQEYVTLDKVDDKDEQADTSNQDDDVKKTPIKRPQSPSKRAKDDEPVEQLPLPPEQLHKWFFKQSSGAKKYSSLFVSELTSKDILSPAIVEWSNRAAVFCINFNRDGKGASMLNFSSDKECKEAKDALQTALGEEVKIAHPSSSTENDIKDALNYRFDGIAALGQKWLTIEDAPPNTTEDQINALFPEGLLAFRPDMNTQAYNWQADEYGMPEKIEELFLVEFSNPKKASSAVEGEKEYELDGVKLKVKLLDKYEDNYKQYYIKVLNEKREKKWEEMEKKKKEVLTDVKLTNEDRLQCYRELEYNVNQRTKLTRNTTINWEEKALEKQKYTAKVFDIVRKIDADTDRRVKEGEKFPEHSRIMTRHTKTEFLKLAPHQRGTYEGKYEGSAPRRSSYSTYSSRGRGYTSYSTYRGRGRGDTSYRGRGGGDTYRGRGGESYRGGRGSYRGRGGSSTYDRESSHYQDVKRRRMDSYDPYDKRAGGRKEDPSVVTNALKSLTEVLSTKMDEMSRIAGGMKARERELENAVHSLKRKGERSPPTTARYHHHDDAGGSYSTSQRRGGGRGAYSSHSYSSYSRTSSAPSASHAPSSHGRYSGGAGAYSTSSSSSSSRYHHDTHGSGGGYSSSSGGGGDRHYVSRDSRAGGGGGGHYSSNDRRSSGGYSSGSGRRGGYH